jgi:UDP-N-acetylglucosamine--N-acetylmuramyl-(pentapeptide) pyrophosphoryl-undecaprenol N-acetylglucosamine transferase
VTNKAPRIWFVAAGTGGHIFPGIAIAREIQALRPDAEFLFFGTRDRLEARLVPEAGFPIRFLSAGRWKGTGVLGRLAGLVQVAAGFFQVLRLVLRGRPNCLVSVGGYVSVPTALACLLARVPFYIVEPNVRAGLANRLLSRFARRAFSVPGGDALRVLRCPVVDAGSPVRGGLKPVEIRPEVKRVLVFGGSQGALALCEAGLRLARDLDFAGRGLELLLQSGEKNYEASQKKAAELGVQAAVKVVSFLSDVPGTLDASDVVIARAGANSVAELAIAGLPTVFVPFPHAADDHQRVNAEILRQVGAALLVDEREAEFQARLEGAVRELSFETGHVERRRRLSGAFRTFGRPHAARDIARVLLGEMKRS